MPTITSGALAAGDTPPSPRPTTPPRRHRQYPGARRPGQRRQRWEQLHVTFVDNTAGEITARAITVAATGDAKVYDDHHRCRRLPTITSGALAPGDSPAFLEAYDTRNVGSGKTLTPSGSVNDGNSVANYAITFVAASSGTITARAITVTAARQYQGLRRQQTAAAASPTITSGSLVSGDSANFSETYSTTRNVRHGQDPHGRPILSTTATAATTTRSRSSPSPPARSPRAPSLSPRRPTPRSTTAPPARHAAYARRSRRARSRGGHGCLHRKLRQPQRRRRQDAHTDRVGQRRQRRLKLYRHLRHRLDRRDHGPGHHRHRPRPTPRSTTATRASAHCRRSPPAARQATDTALSPSPSTPPTSAPTRRSPRPARSATATAA